MCCVTLKDDWKVLVIKSYHNMRFCITFNLNWCLLIALHFVSSGSHRPVSLQVKTDDPDMLNPDSHCTYARLRNDVVPLG